MLTKMIEVLVNVMGLIYFIFKTWYNNIGKLKTSLPWTYNFNDQLKNKIKIG
jgi:hypothetical protein